MAREGRIGPPRLDPGHDQQPECDVAQYLAIAIDRPAPVELHAPPPVGAGIVRGFLGAVDRKRGLSGE